MASAQTTVKSFFPKGKWVSMNKLDDFIEVTDEKGEWKDLAVAADGTSKLPVYMMPGTAIPHLPNDKKYTTTTDLNKNAEVHVLINRDEEGFAQGSMYFDEG